MDAGAQLAAATDLESGAAAVDAWAYPADPRLKERQPFTWLRAAPYLAVMLAGAALFAAGVAVGFVTHRAVLGGALYSSGVFVAMLGYVAAAVADEGGWFDRNLRRFGLDD